MLTFSVNTGTITESSNLSGITDVLNIIPDNTQKLIDPEDVRDAVFTNWTNIIFKQTTTNGINYIGIDNDPAGIALKNSIYFGKRQLLGLDIMSTTLLNSDIDTFFYNNKIDTSSDQDTKVSFLSGTDSTLYNVAPYLHSEYVIGDISTYLDFNIRNQSGNINLISDNANISFNGVLFPSFLQTSTASVGDTLIFRQVVIGGNTQSYLDWETIDLTGTGSFYSSSTFSITGNPVLINGAPMTLTNPTPTPVTIGGVLAGSTFSDASIISILTRLLYPYVIPSINLSLSVTSTSTIIGNFSSNVVSEVNTLTSETYHYTMISYSDSIISATATVPGSNPPSGYLPVTPGSNFTGSSNIVPATMSGVSTYSVAISDGTQSATASVSLNLVYPYYYGTMSTHDVSISGGPFSFQTFITNSLLIKDVSVFSNKLVDLSAVSSVYVYFMYPSTYPDIISIIDPSSFNVTSSFYEFSSNYPIFTANWSTLYKIYIYGPGGTASTTAPSGTYSFNL